MGSTIPLSRVPVPSDHQARIRDAVRSAETIGTGIGESRLAQMNDAEPLSAFLSNPAVHAPIYSLPQVITPKTIAEFIGGHIEERAQGVGLLFVRTNPSGEIIGYSDFQIWPEWAAGELGGALHPSLQSQGRGAAGAASSFDWMFQALHLELICATAALDNVRTAKLLDALGFERMGEIDSVRADGTTRRSKVWELPKREWRLRKSLL
jgi:RimJ/RimL family protein N-acetyltransferase